MKTSCTSARNGTPLSLSHAVDVSNITERVAIVVLKLHYFSYLVFSSAW